MGKEKPKKPITTNIVAGWRNSTKWAVLFSAPIIDGAYGIYIRLASGLEEANRIAITDSHHVRGIRTSASARMTAAPRFPLGQTNDR
jgi:hypothetical protein